MDTSSFTAALEIANSGQADIAKAQRESAESYLMALQSSVEGLNLSFHILSNEAVSAVRFFWATNTILVHLPSLSGSISNERSEEIYQSLFACIHRYFIATYHSPAGATPSSSGVSDLILNKHAQMMVAGFQLLFPYGQWNRFLFDVLEMRRRASGQFFEDPVTMYVLRVLEYIDERVVSVRERVERDKEQRESDMKIKDAMREEIIPDLVEVWYEVLFDSRSHRPEMIKLCLNVVKVYAEWIDIGLLLHDRWIHLMYYFLTLPLYRESVCECILALINKKQLPELKRETLLRLHIVDQIPKLMEMVLEASKPRPESLPTRRNFNNTMKGCGESSIGEEDGTASGFIDAVAVLITAVATHLLTVVDACSAALRLQEEYMQLHGCLPPEGSNALVEHSDSTLNVLHLVVSYVIQLLAAQQLQVPMTELLNFFQIYVKSSYFMLSEAEMVLDPLFERTILYEILNTPETVWDEGVIEDRKSILLVVRLIYRQYPDVVCQHMQHIVWCATRRVEESLPAPPENVSDQTELSATSEEMRAKTYYFHSSPPFLEAVLRYVYEMGSAMKLEQLKDPEMPLTQVIERLLRTGETCFLSPVAAAGGAFVVNFYGREGYPTAAAAVHLGFFETMCRYNLFMVYYSDYLRILLELLLLHPYGVLHPHERTRGRICSLLRQLVFALLSTPLASPLLVFALDMVKALYAVVAINDTKSELNHTFSANDRRELFETTGMLLSAAAVCCENGSEKISVGQEVPLLAPFKEQLQLLATALLGQLGRSSRDAEAIRSTSTFNVSQSNASHNQLPEELVADCLSFCSSWAKGLRLGYTNSSTNSSAVLAMWQQSIDQTLSGMLQSIGPVWQTFHFSSVVRERTGQFFGQLINTIPMYEEALETPLQQYLVSSLSPTGITSTSSGDLNRLLRLLHQLVGKAGHRAEETLQNAIPLIWENMKQCVGPLPAVTSTPSAESPAPESVLGSVHPLAPHSSNTAFAFGVLSEKGRECVEVYKNYFLLLANAATFSCSATILTLPENTWNETLEQLRAALALPAELEVPKGCLQLFSRLLESVNNFGSAKDTAGEASDGPQQHAELCRMVERLRHPVLYVFIPTALCVFTSPTFDWKDAKNSFLSTEFALLAQGSVKQFGEEALQVLYTSFEPYVGGEASQLWCVQLRDETRVTPRMKSQLRSMLSGIQQLRMQ